MTDVEVCSEERAVIESVNAGLWPDHAPAELREHVAGCAACGEVANVALMLREAHDDGWREAQVPSSGLVWWRAEMRARAEAARVASRPMTIVQGIALACFVCAVIAGLGVWAGSFSNLVGLFSSLAPADGWRVAASSNFAALAGHGALIAVIAGMLLVPVAAYLATNDK